MEGKSRFVFPIIMGAMIVFVVSAVVTYFNIGFRVDFVRRWLSAFLVGWPVAAVLGLFAIPFARLLTRYIVDLIDKVA